MFPRFIRGTFQDEADERPALRPGRLSQEAHIRLVRQPVRLADIARNTGADDVFPVRLPAVMTRDHVVEIQLASVKNAPAILALVFIALKDVVAGKLDFLLRKLVKGVQQNDLGHPDPIANRMHTRDIFQRWILARKIDPIHQAEHLIAVFRGVNNLGMVLAKEAERSLQPDDIHGLPQAIQYQNLR